MIDSEEVIELSYKSKYQQPKKIKIAEPILFPHDDMMTLQQLASLPDSEYYDATYPIYP